MDSRDTTAESASREPNLVKPVASFSPSFQQARPQAPAGYPRGPPSNGPVGGAPAARPAGQAQLRRLDSRTALTGPNQYPQVRLGPPRPPGGPFPQRGPYPQNVQGYPPRFPQQPQLQLQQQRPQQQQLPPRSGSQPGQFQRPARPQVEGPPLTRNESVLNLSKRGPQQLDDANRQQARQQVAAGRMMTDVGSVGGKLQQMDSPQRRKAADVRENGENDDDDDVVMDNRKPVKNGETVQRVESETKLGRLMGNEGKPTEAGQDDKTVARSGIDGSVKREEAKAGQGRPESGKIEDSVKSNSIGVDDKSGEVRVIEKVEKEIEEKVKSEKDKLEKELDKEKAEKERAEKENAEKEKAEKEKEKAEKEKEKAEKEKAEREKLEKEKAEKEKLEKEKAERERLEREEAEKEKLEREKAEKEKLEREKAEKEKLEREKAEKEKLEREKAEKEKLEREKAEKEKLEREKAEKERLEKERAERELQEKLDKEKAEKEQSEKDKAEQESINKLDICKPEPKKDEPPKEVDKSKEEKPSSKAEDRQDSEPSQPAETVKDSSPEKVSEEESKKAQPPRMSVDLEKPSPPVLQQRKEDESPHDKSRASTPGEVRPETPAVSEDGLRVPRKPETRSSSPADADNNTTTDTTDASEPEKLVVDSLSLDVNEEVTVSIEECPNEGAQAEGARSPIGSVKGYDNGQRRSLRSSRSSLSTSPVSPKSPTTEASRLLPERKRATFNEETIGTGRKQQDEHQKPAKPGKVQRAPTPAKLNEKGPSAKSEIENGTGTNDPAQPNTLPTTNGVADSPTKKSPSKSRDGDKRSTAGSPVKSPSKSAKSLPRTPDTPSSTAGQEKKKLPMNKIQVGSAPSPNLKTVRSKIGSLENASYKPGGGKVKIENRKLDFSKAQPKIAAKNEKYTPSGGDKKIAQVKLQWNAKPKVGSLENATYKPGGGDKKIETVKLDFKDKAKPKVGSKDNAKHVPGGGSVKSSATPPKTPQDSSNDIQTQKLDIKAESKIGSLDNVKHKPGGGEKKIFNDRDYLRQTGSNVESLSGSGSQSPVPSGAITDGKNGLPASDENLNQGC